MTQERGRDARISVRASALVIGGDASVSRGLCQMAVRSGFAEAKPLPHVLDVAPYVDAIPLVFFLCAPAKDVATLKPIANGIRFSADLRVRFLPLIYFTPDPSADTIRRCIQMGFDDVIALPYSGDMAERIERQVGSTQVYYETATYFGPDRRNRLGAPRSGKSDQGGGEFRRIEIVRTERGVDVLRDDFQVVI